VYWAEECVLDDEAIYDETNFRKQLIKKTKDMALGVNKAVEVAAGFKHSSSNAG